MESTSVRSSAPENPLISRRTVVRAAAASAWTVPVVVTASPAAAGPVVSPAMTTLQWAAPAFHAQWLNNGAQLRVTGWLQNTGTRDATVLVLKIVLPGGAKASSARAADDGWSSSDAHVNTFVFGGADLATGTANARAVDITFEMESSPSGDVNAIASAKNAAEVSTVDTVAAGQQSAALLWDKFAAQYDPGDSRNLNISAAIKNTATTIATGVKILVTLPVSATAKPADPNGWSISGTGKSFTFTRTGSQISSTSSPAGFNVAFPIADGSGGQAGFAVSADAGVSVPQSQSVTVGQAAAMLRIASLSSNRTSVNKVKLMATIENIAPVNSKSATNVLLTMKLLRPQHPSPTFPGSSKWSEYTASGSGSVGATYVFRTTETLSAGSGTPSSNVQATLDYPSDSTAGSLALEADATASNALSAHVVTSTKQEL